MTDSEIAELADFLVGRAQHLVRLASVSDPVTWLRYLVAVHLEIRPQVDQVSDLLRDEEPQTLPN